MMTIVMYCDRCGSEISASTAGGVRLRTGKRELSLHLCQTHQDDLRELVQDFCEQGDPREVQPSLKAS
jgi:ribosomal protein S11